MVAGLAKAHGAKEKWKVKQLFKWCWFVGAILLATPALAGIYVNGTTGSDSNDGTINSPYATMAKANNNASTAAGKDTVFVADWATAYDAFPEPNSNIDGTANHFIVYIGDTAACNKVIVPGGIYTANYVKRLGFRFTSGVSDLYYDGGVGCVLAKCKIFTGYNTLHGSNQLIRNTTFGADSGYCYFQVNPLLQNDSDNNGTDICIQDCTFRLRPIDNVDTYTMFRLQGEGDGAQRILRFRFYRNDLRVEMPDGTTPLSDRKIIFINRMKNSHFVGNTIAFVDSSGFNDGSHAYQAIVFRDGLDSVFCFNNTFSATTERAGKGAATINLCGSGNRLESNGSGNTFRWCTFKNYTPSAHAVYYEWRMQDNDSLTYCAVICSTGVANAGFSILGVGSGRAHVWRNTFINIGTGSAFRADKGGDWIGDIIIRNNIFYTRATTAGEYAASFDGITLNHIYSDYNDFAHFNSSGQDWFVAGVAGVGSGSVPCNGKRWECNSIAKSPAFTDSVGDDWNLVPRGTPVAGQTSFLVGAGFGGNTIGQQDTTLQTADGTAPAAISDLTATTLGSTTISLGWTAPGDDNSSGTATSYDIRYSTDPITSGNFSAATRITGPTPAVAGTHQGTNAIGLASSTLYYFAIKAIDEVGNAGAVSNFPFATTNASGSGGYNGETP